jgi:hypothetical protein
MAVSARDELKLYGNLVYNALFGPKYDLYKIPGPPGYWLWGGCRRERRAEGRTQHGARATRHLGGAANLLNPPARHHQPPHHPPGHIPHLSRPDYHVQALEWADKYGPITRFSIGGQHVVRLLSCMGDRSVCCSAPVSNLYPLLLELLSALARFQEPTNPPINQPISRPASGSGF